MTNIPDEGKLKDRWRKDGNAEGFKFDSVWCGSLWIIHEQQPNRVKRVVSLLCLSVFLFLPAPLAGPPLPFHTISHSVFSFSLPYSSTRRPPRTFFSHGFPLAPLAASLSTISYSFYHRPIRFLLYMYVCTTPSPSSASRSLTRFFLSSSVFFLTRLPSLWTFSSRTTSHHGWKRIFHFQFSCFCVLSARSSDRTLELNSRIPRPTAPPECGANIRPNREMNNSIRSRGLWLDFRRVRNVFEKCNHRTIRSQDGWLGGEKCVWNLQLRISTFKIREKTSNPKQFCIELAIYLVRKRTSTFSSFLVSFKKWFFIPSFAIHPNFASENLS